jgi:hypothetical protein
MTALAGGASQVPSLCEDLLSSIDQPLKLAKDKQSGKDYLLCDYNRDGDSYRCVGVCEHQTRGEGREGDRRTNERSGSAADGAALPRLQFAMVQCL